MDFNIKLFEPSITDNTRKRVMDVLDSGQWYSGTSRLVEEFENRLKEYLGCRHVIAVNSGTAALHMVMMLFKPTDVFVPSISFVSTAMAPYMAGHKVRFTDISKAHVTMKIPDKLPNDCILLPVHFGGLPCDIEGDFTVVEDAAHAMGSKLSTRNIKCFSFHAIKNLNMPNGGAIALYDDMYYDRLKSMRWCGLYEFDGFRDVRTKGLNYIMNNISAVMGTEQLKTLDKDNKRRLEIAMEYQKRLQMFKMPISPDCSYHLYWVQVKNRDEFRARMAKHGIETGIHYPRIDGYSFFDDADLPATKKVEQDIVTLPIHPNLTNEDLDRVIKSANSSV